MVCHEKKSFDLSKKEVSEGCVLVQEDDTEGLESLFFCDYFLLNYSRWLAHKVLKMFSIHSQLNITLESSIQNFGQFPLVVDTVLIYFSKIAWYL